MSGFFIGYFLGSIVVFIMNFNFMTGDKNIKSQERFKLGDSVYQCKEVQKLEYGK